MKKAISALLAIAMISASCIKEDTDILSGERGKKDASEKMTGWSKGEIVPGTLLVKLDGKTAERIAKGDIKAVAEELMEGSSVSGIAPALPVAPKNTEVAEKYGLHQWYRLSFDKGADPQTIAAEIAGKAMVRSVQLNRFDTPVTSPQVVPFDAVPVTKASEPDPYPFNDEYLRYQWNLINDGTISEGAVEGADVGIKDAWKLCCGDPSVVVAVIDDAIKYMHEDLKEAMWVNTAEKEGDINKDDDGNGYIDDRYGFNFVGMFEINEDWIADRLDGEKPDPAIKGNTLNASKGSGHGTHVAGIIGAVNGNGKGVSSIAGGDYANGKQGVRLMSCQIFEGSTNGGTDAMKAAAYIYAADNGACIAQCSYGNPSIITSDEVYINGDGDDLDGYPLEYAALQYFLDEGNSNNEALEGNIAVFSAGNHANPYSIYPAALPFCISVTAHTCQFLPAGYSNYGPGCKISAPGGEYVGYAGQYAELILSTGVSGAAIPQPVINGDTDYVYMYGTSMACPHVSGVLALGISYAKQLGKKFTRDEMTSMLLTSVNDIDRLLSPGGTRKYYDIAAETFVDLPFDRYYKNFGTGAVDAWQFLMAIEGTPIVTAKVGEAVEIDLEDYMGPIAGCNISIDETSRESLGITNEPVIENGVLKILCSRLGAGKVTLSSEVGKDPAKEDGIGGMAFSREISIISRPFAPENGRWL